MESPAFLEAQRKKENPTSQEALTLFRMLALRKKNYWYFFGIEAVTPLTLYFTLRACSDLLKSAGLSGTQVISHNFIVTVVNLAAVILYGWLTLKYDPLTILKRRFLAGLCLIPPLMWVLSTFPGEATIFTVQVLLLCLIAGSTTPAQFKVVQAFPVIGRCTNLGSVYAFSHAMMYVVTSSCVFFLDQVFGLWGIGALFMVTTAVALWCAHRFIPVEKAPPSEYDRAVEILKRQEESSGVLIV